MSYFKVNIDMALLMVVEIDVRVTLILGHLRGMLFGVDCAGLSLEMVLHDTGVRSPPVWSAPGCAFGVSSSPGLTTMAPW